MDNEKQQKVSLVRSFLQFDNKIDIIGTCTHLDDSVTFSGYEVERNKATPVYITLSKRQMESLQKCETIPEIYKNYKNMRFLYNKKPRN